MEAGEVTVTLLILLPLGGSALLLAFGRRLGEPGAGVLGTLTVGAGFVLSVVAGWGFLAGTGEALEVPWFDWLPALGVRAGLLWDPLSALMAMVVTGVGALIHLYSIGYMRGDPRFGRFFAYMNLFVASMLILVLADGFALLFVGWELVGLCSYLLISFWFERPAAAAAGKKAFVVNRVGDAGFLVALMLVFAAFGSLRYADVFSRAPAELTTGSATAITLLLLMGAVGKSAQFPLYVWLPDAMEGPTPVSALIHAATMVTAGVFMVARTGALFELAPASAAVVAVVGMGTALYAATIAVAQHDVKRVLAYSTISQLGYMFAAVGAGAYVAGMFHLTTHAFFKALLFLGAGAVIHSLAGEQDMRRMGGLWRKLPVTTATMVVAWLAISGIPPFSGFWSKDEILATIFERGGLWRVIWALGLLTALITAFYMTRMIYLTFFGERRWPEGAHPHEAPWPMGLPLAVLAVLAMGGGLLNTPWRLGLEHFLEPAFHGVPIAAAGHGFTQMVLAIVSSEVALAGILLAVAAYRRGPRPAEEQPEWDLVRRGYGVDEAYARVFAAGGGAAARLAAGPVDQKGIDGLVNGVGVLVRTIGEHLRPLQSGFVRNYGVSILVGAVALLAWFLSRGGW
ncbi:MAG TPA: NADH-quinone oxidoreductase subunit L [Acidimicrobiia bacterium]|nr:NADH-quinone oxidoreductase subunit L [Acidimicrobiia bacterium]